MSDSEKHGAEEVVYHTRIQAKHISMLRSFFLITTMPFSTIRWNIMSVKLNNETSRDNSNKWRPQFNFELLSHISNWPLVCRSGYGRRFHLQDRVDGGRG